MPGDQSRVHSPLRNPVSVKNEVTGSTGSARSNNIIIRITSSSEIINGTGRVTERTRKTYVQQLSSWYDDYFLELLIIQIYYHFPSP